MSDPEFRADLFRGTGQAYDRFRLPYPRMLIDDLARRCGADGAGALLDLACGTGQLGFALHSQFGAVWAADQEPGMIAIVRRKAQAAGLAGIRTEITAAEHMAAPAGSFQLVAIGNAFHRFRREVVAANVLRWLRPGGCLALVWGGSPWDGDAAWQLALGALMRRWRPRAEAAGERIPPGYEHARSERTDAAILADAGFELAGSWTFQVEHEWTPDAVAGYLASTSVLSSHALGDRAPEFDADLRRELRAWAGHGLRQLVSFRYELARRPVPEFRTPDT